MTTDLVLECSNTIGYFDVAGYLTCAFPSTPLLDGYLTTRLRSTSPLLQNPKTPYFDAHNITVTLQIIEYRKLQRITIHPYVTTAVIKIKGTVRREREDLRRLLVRFRTSHDSPKDHLRGGFGRRGFDYAPSLSPELMRGGLVDLVQYEFRSGLW